MTLSARYSSLLIAILAAWMLSSCAIDRKQTHTPPPASSGIGQKKAQFFDLIRPIVIRENQRLQKERARIAELDQRRRQGKHISGRDQAWLISVARQYKIPHADLSHDTTWQELLARVDIIPLELVLAQAANESAWGTSRFAREGNNYFGQWCYQKGCGIVPRRRNAGATHEVARYASVDESVKSYMHNLNTSPAYASLRNIRRQARQHHREPDAIELTHGLSKYSERGQAYVRALQSLIRSNAELMQQRS